MSFTSTETISVITVCYQSASTIRRTFDSVLAQTVAPDEYVVMDGASTDATLAIIQEYEPRFAAAGIRFVWKSERDQGIYDAMNKGIALSTGSIIGILNSDDGYEPGCMEAVRAAACEHPEVDIYHGLLRYIADDGHVVWIQGTSVDKLREGMIEHPTCFVRRTTYERIGSFDLRYRYVADYDLMLRAQEAGCSFLLLDAILADFSLGGASSTTASVSELLRLKKRYHLENPIYTSLKQAYYGVRLALHR